MLVGINALAFSETVLESPEERFLRRILRTARQLQSDTQFLVFTAAEATDFEGWPCSQVGGAGGLQGLLGGGASVDRAAKREKVEVLVSPMGTSAGGAAMPEVLYALHLAPWEGPDQQKKNIKLAKRICSGARAIVVPSHYLRRRFLELFEIPLDKVTVAKAGVSPVFAGPHESMIERPYMVIYIDALASFAMPFLLQLLEHLEGEFPHTFLFAGPGCENEPEDWGGRGVRIESCSDAQLSGLYQHSDLFLYPGHFDGGGIALLEAMHAGVPIVAAQSGANSEVAGHTPVYYNPESRSSAMQAIRRVLDETEEQRKNRLSEGRRITTDNSWEKSTWKFLSALKRP